MGIRWGAPAVMRIGIVSLFLSAGLRWAAPAGWTQEVETGVSRSNPVPITSVFGVPRPEKSDLLLLENGDTLAGTLLNETIRLRTAYAGLILERRMLAGIDFRGDTQGLASVITINSNQFSGFLEDPVFSLQPRSGTRMEVRREKVAKVVFGWREGERQGIPQGRWVRLKTGDCFSGQLLDDPLILITANGRIPVNVKEMVSLAGNTNRPMTMTIFLRNEQVLEGRSEAEDISIQLDVGPKLALYVENIDCIRERPDFPPRTGLAVPQPAYPRRGSGPSANSGPTTIEGMVWIPAGQFVMGSPNDEAGRDPDEGPQTQVTFTQGFWMGKCEVTQAEYQAVTGTNPSSATGDPTRPVEKVNWYEAMEYCTKLTQRASAASQMPDGYAYRLPTEAEWEYACRAGTTTRFSYGDDKTETQLENYAWFTRNSDSQPHPVGTKRPNPWGLQDVHGNVWEWCLDRWEGGLPGGSVTNSPVAAAGTLRAARGGSWLYENRACRSANRDDYSPSNRCSDMGFRVVLALEAARGP